MPTPSQTLDIPHATTAAARAWFAAFKRRSEQRWAERRRCRNAALGLSRPRPRVNSWQKNDARYAEDAPVMVRQ